VTQPLKELPTMASVGPVGDVHRDLSLPELVAELAKAKWLIAGTTAVFVMLFGTVALVTPPVFKTIEWVLPADNDRLGGMGAQLGSLNGLASMVGIDLNAAQGTKTQEALAILHSREFRQALIRDADLMPRLFADRWDTARKTWKKGFRKAPGMPDALRLFDDIVIIGRNEKTGLYSIEVEWTNPGEAARWADFLVVRVNSEMRVRAIRRSDALVGYLEKELETTDAVGTREAISRLLASQINERMLASVTVEYAFKVVERAPVPDRKFKPRIGLQSMVGAIAGVLVGIVFVFVRLALRDNVRGRAGQ
jgi:uncharacterized protein involved in exopolysaccharide biosynthesis